MDPIELIKQGKIKRFFRATKKLNAPGLVFHITQRATGKDPLFLEDGDYLFMLALMKEWCQKHLLNLYAFCLMPNHVHLLFSTEEANLYDAMRNLFSKYAMQFNKKYERRGHLFGGPYRQAVCLDDSYLLAASLYIHLNPYRAGLVTDARKYRWSSCKWYYGYPSVKAFVDPAFILRLLHGDNVKRKEQYELLLNRGREIATDHVLEKEDAVEHFGAKLRAAFPSIFRKVDNAKKALGSLSIDLMGGAELDERIESFRRGGPSPEPTGRAAKKYLVEQLIARGYKRGEIAERLGVSLKTVYNIVKPPK